MAGCFACDVNTGRLTPPGGTIYDDEHWIADHAYSRLVVGSVVLKPKPHVHEVADLHAHGAVTLEVAAQRLLGAMRTALDPERTYICSLRGRQCTACVSTCSPAAATCPDSVPISSLTCSLSAGTAASRRRPMRRLAFEPSSQARHIRRTLSLGTSD